MLLIVGAIFSSCAIALVPDCDKRLEMLYSEIKELKKRQGQKKVEIFFFF